MIQCEVGNVAFSNAGFVVFLQENEGKRVLPIFVGILEAKSIASRLNNETFPRPLTHDLLKNVVEQLGYRVSRVEVCDLIDNTFYGKLFLEQDNKSLEIDSRPSDAIALALRFSAPIFVAEKVMDEAGQVMEEPKEEVPEQLKQEAEKKKLPLMEQLKLDLKKAIEEERYEDAAKIRDRINEETKKSDAN